MGRQSHIEGPHDRRVGMPRETGEGPVDVNVRMVFGAQHPPGAILTPEARIQGDRGDVAGKLEKAVATEEDPKKSQIRPGGNEADVW